MPSLSTFCLGKIKNVDPTATTFHTLFEWQVKNNPNKEALVFMGNSISYQQLNNQANQLAHLLIRKGIHKESIVGVLLHRGISTVICLLAILKAGGAFLLIDAEFPINRINFILKDSNAGFLFVNDKTMHLVEKTTPAINIDEYNFSDDYFENPNVGRKSTDLVYVVYTSGSTGNPKGVLIEQKGLVNALLNSIAFFKLTSDDRIISLLSFSFDGSIWDITVALLLGATLYITNEKERMSPKKFAILVKNNSITVTMLTPSLIRIFPDKILKSIKTLISAGEACTLDLISKSGPGCKFFNGYGPTEASIFTTLARCKKNDFYISIGAPIKNTHVYVLDHMMEPVMFGKIGTLYIGGIGLARGYLNNFALTQEKFIKKQWNDGSCETLYNSGDRVFFNSSGFLEYVGREDNEIKISGNRINLNDIECVLLKHPEIKNCIVKKLRYKQRNRIGVVIETNNRNLDLRQIKKYLSESLPKYMLPHELINVTKLPLSSSGKIERDTLLLERA